MPLAGLAAALLVLVVSPAATARVPLQVSGYGAAWPATWWHTWLDGGQHVQRQGLSNGGGVSLEAFVTPWLAVGLLADAMAVSAPGEAYPSPMPVVGMLASARLVLPARGKRVVEPCLRVAAGYALFVPEGAGREHGWAVRFRPGVQYVARNGATIFLEAGYHHDGYRHDYRGQDDDPGGDLRVMLHALEVCLGLGWRF